MTPTSPGATGRGRLLLAACIGAVLAACSGAADSAEESTVVDPASGEALYRAHCAECHGADLRGTDKGPSHLSVVYEPAHHSDAAFLLAVRKGARAHHWTFGDMPAVPGLSDDQVVEITAYVREVQRREGFEPYPP